MSGSGIRWITRAACARKARRTSAPQTPLAQAAQAQASGLMPLDYMLSIMRDENEPLDRRMEMAIAATPYMHPKLRQVEVNGRHAVGPSEELRRLLELHDGETSGLGPLIEERGAYNRRSFTRGFVPQIFEWSSFS